MSNNLDNQTTATTTAEDQLFTEIRQILVNLPAGSYVVVYLPLEGPVTYSYKNNNLNVKGVFDGDYTKRTLKNLVNIVRRGVYSFAEVTSNGLYSYRFSIEEEKVV